MLESIQGQMGIEAVQYVVLIRRYLQSSVTSVDTEMKDQIWMKLSLINNVLLRFVYVPPTDSQYFNPNSFSYIQEKSVCVKEENCHVLLMGDLDTRFGILMSETSS